MPGGCLPPVNKSLSRPARDRPSLSRSGYSDASCGSLCIHRKKINISTALAGQRLGVKEVDDAAWLVSFMNYDHGYIDLEQRTVQPIDNPFGSRLSPMY